MNEIVESSEEADVTSTGPTEEMQEQIKKNEEYLAMTLEDRGKEPIGNIHKYA